MDPVTHMIAGALIAQTVSPEDHRFAFAFVAAGAAFVPDLDFLARRAKQKLLFLKLHRGLTHSLVAAPVIASCAAVCGSWIFGAPFLSLFIACLLSVFSHLCLDSMMHSSGLKWLWPYQRKYNIPLVIGLNPLTTSARCGERRLTVCLRCTMHSAVLSPLVLILWFGFLVAAVHPRYPLVAILTLGAAAGYALLCVALRRRATSLLRSHLAQADEGAGRVSRVRSFPASHNPWRWIGVQEEEAGGFSVFSVDVLRRHCSRAASYPPSDEGPAVQTSLETETVKEFLQNAVCPHAQVLVGSDRQLVVWRDLAFAFSPVVSLFAARVEIGPHQEISSEEFRERWDAPLDVMSHRP